MAASTAPCGTTASPGSGQGSDPASDSERRRVVLCRPLRVCAWRPNPCPRLARFVAVRLGRQYHRRGVSSDAALRVGFELPVLELCLRPAIGLASFREPRETKDVQAEHKPPDSDMFGKAVAHVQRTVRGKLHEDRPLLVGRSRYPPQGCVPRCLLSYQTLAPNFTTSVATFAS